MNIFVTDQCPVISATNLCDKHINKMLTEAYQMLGSALRRWGAEDEDMPLTKSGTPLIGGYPNHPCTIWAGETSANFKWLCDHASAMAREYTKRYSKVHHCEDAIKTMFDMLWFIPQGELTLFAQAMPAQYRIDNDAVRAYRRYYIYEKSRFALWERGTSPPQWYVSGSHTLYIPSVSRTE